MRGADVVAQTLAAAGVKTIFTLSGNQIMPVFDACIDADIRLIHVRHEAAAVFMADAWAQLTGEVGVALVTAAPGFSNALGPLFTARASESPVLLLSGDSPVSADGLGPFQELDQAAVAAPLVKAAYRPTDGEALGRDMVTALKTARAGRPGPVQVALAFDVLNEEVADMAVSEDLNLQSQALDADALEIIVKFLSAAERPLILTGPSLNTNRSTGRLDQASNALGVPVLSLESPRGLKDPSLGDLPGILGAADAVLCLGKKIDFTLNFGRTAVFDPACKFLVIEPEPVHVERARKALGDRLIGAWQADAGPVLDALIGQDADAANLTDWRAKVARAIAARVSPTEDVSPEGRIQPIAVCREIQKVLDQANDPVLVLDGGEFGQWAMALLNSPMRLINGPAGAIGGGICYAIGAKANRPDATVIAVMGDGTTGFHLSEFETAVRNDLPFVAIVGNDARWNAEYQIQLRDFGKNRLIGCELAPTRYDLAVEGLGGHGEYVTSLDQLPGALQRALASRLPACINVEIEGLAAPAGPSH